jgi:hypothetical protein
MTIHRHSPHHVPAHVAVLHRLRRLFGLRHSHVLHKGQHHPVNAHWHEANTAKWPHLAGRSRHELRAIQDKLLLKSNDVRLSKDELDYLRAANNHFDVRTCVDKLKGRHHSEFGFEGVDQLHFNSHSHPCGCALEVVFDHHGASAGNMGKLHPHHPLEVCDAHAPHAHDLELLHARVAADTRGD